MLNPGGILGEIAAGKKAELQARFDGVSIDTLRARAEPTRRSLCDAIARSGGRFILEIKKASPSQGPIRLAADVASLARGYAGVADALSVLTEAAASVVRSPTSALRVRSLTGRSSPRTFSLMHARWWKRGLPAPTRSW